MALKTFSEAYDLIKQDFAFKPGELSMIMGGRGAGKSWFMQQYMPLWDKIPPFVRVEHENLRHDMIMCDVNQEIQDWLMQNFEPGKMWKYTSIKDSNGNAPTHGRDRVAMRQDVYTALVLRWS